MNNVQMNDLTVEEQLDVQSEQVDLTWLLPEEAQLQNEETKKRNVRGISQKQWDTLKDMAERYHHVGKYNNCNFPLRLEVVGRHDVAFMERLVARGLIHCVERYEMKHGKHCASYLPTNDGLQKAYDHPDYLPF